MYFILDIGFTNKRRDDLVFSDADLIRLDPVDDMVKLKVDQFNRYPITGPNVRSPVRSPVLAKFYAGFEAEVTLPTGTSVDYRLGDGTNVYYWTGATWALATTDAHWSTEVDIADNIIFFNTDTIPAMDWPNITVFARLLTTDPFATPELMEVRLLVETLEFDMVEEILYNTLIPRLKTVRYPVRIKFKTDASGTTLDLNNLELGLELPRVVDGEAVYNQTTDPKETKNIFSSYAAGIITFTGSVPIDQDLLIILWVSPQVSVTPHIGASTGEAQGRIGLEIASLLIDFFK